MMKVGIISDTHGYLDNNIFKYFEEVDEIWHAGDAGSLELLDELSRFKPLRAVYGNIDDYKVRSEYPEDYIFSVEGLKVYMTHIGGHPGAYAPRAKKFLKAEQPDVFVCGHSHILRVMRDSAFKNMLYLNPGAAGIHGFHKVRTLLRLDLHEKKAVGLQAIELGKRGAIV
ncbi:MAG: metallophosphoesterase family protein [Chitinophagales bacterium]|nr:metallophosphatase family protein [Chitinophagales bacterium]MDW8272725.1 metallophosphoesterase family protein [Chitinophagales bacterium]